MALTGGKFPTGTQPNGTRESGGTMAFITDDPLWGYPTQMWQRDTWFAETAGQAMTFKNDGSIVYDNNGLEDGTQGDFYNAQAQGTANAATPGLYQNYAMANNYDWIYASYFKIEQAMEVDQMIGYFNGDGFYNTMDPHNPLFQYQFNIWSTVGTCTQANVGCLPVNTGSFNGNVYSTGVAGAGVTTSYTGANRVFADGSTDPIWRVVFTLNSPLLLQPGEYYGGHYVALEQVPEPASLTLLALSVLGGGLLHRRRKS